jgi:hypothetical protein
MHICNTFIQVMKNILIMPLNIARVNKSELYAIASFYFIFHFLTYLGSIGMVAM